MLKIVNKVQIFRSNLTFALAEEIFDNCKVYVGRPTMIKVRISKNTLLIFKNGRCRIMGDALEQNDILSTLPFMIHDCKITTMTFVYDLNRKINCYKLSGMFHFEPEIIVAAYAKMPEHINVFPSGNIVMLGLKSEQRAYDILNTIYIMLESAFI